MRRYEPVDEYDLTVDAAIIQATSPTVEVTETENGHLVTITDAAGEKSFEVLNGDPGYSPTVTVTEITGGHRVVITDESGDHAFDVMDGEGGGSAGKGITSCVLNADYTLTINYTDGTSDTVGPIRGEQGPAGADGYSPTVSVVNITGGHRLTIRTKTADDQIDIMDGVQGPQGPAGADGSNGVSPVVTMEPISGTPGGYHFTLTDAGGTHTFDIMNGAEGQQGPAGRAPTITTTRITNPDGYRITIIDEVGTRSVEIYDGADGQGVPAGGTAGQFLVKQSATDYDAAWTTVPAAAGSGF